MLEQLKYKNHMNEVIDFGRNGIFAMASDLHDYSWTVVQKNNRITGFQREVTTRTLPVTILCGTVAEGVAARNRLMEVAERDVLAKQPGKIIIGDYYFECYITASKKSSYLKTRRLMETSLTITSDKGYWVKENLHSFRKAGAAGQGLDYEFDFAYDYTSDFLLSSLNNTDFTASNFRMILYGPCSDPAVYVAGHAYTVNCDVGTGEYLTIDSGAKTVTRVAADGTVINEFNQRGRNQYVFEKIPAGNNTISWNGDFDVDVILLEERSEPKWT